jgi:hypothetical protein
MSTLFGGAQQTPQQTEELRSKRQEYLDYLSTQQTNTNADVNKNALTPESGTAILNVIKVAQDWLTANPNADLNTVLANREKTNVEIRRIMDTDRPKNTLTNYFTLLPSIAKQGEQKQILKAEAVPKLDAIAKEKKEWFTKNKATATRIDFDTQAGDLTKKIQQAIGDSAGIDFVNAELKKVENLSPENLNKQLQKNERSLQSAQDQEIDLGKGAQQAINTATTTVLSLLLIGFCILCGSLAANLAMGRAPAYRVLYFLWGCFPLFAPIVFLYTLYRRIRFGRIPMYAILPVSIEPATTRFSRFLWYPFYYVPDVEAATMFKQFKDSVEAAATL